MVRGYYSLVQYCPDPSRLEAVNVGLVLFCPDLPYLSTRFARRRTPVQRLFGKQDWDFFEAEQSAMEARLQLHPEEFPDLDRFESFIAKRAGAFRLTAPRPVKVSNPAQEFDRLFKLLVKAGRTIATTSPRALEVQIRRRFKEEGVAQLVKTGVTVHPPGLPREFKAPFAYKNGRMNLIEPVRFDGMSPERVFNRASVGAVQGRFLMDYEDMTYGKLGLTVIGSFGPREDEQRRAAEAVFLKENIRMLPASNIDPLIDEIRRFAHD